MLGLEAVCLGWGGAAEENSKAPSPPVQREHQILTLQADTPSSDLSQTGSEHFLSLPIFIRHVTRLL